MNHTQVKQNLIKLDLSELHNLLNHITYLMLSKYDKYSAKTPHTTKNIQAYNRLYTIRQLVEEEINNKVEQIKAKQELRRYAIIQ